MSCESDCEAIRRLTRVPTSTLTASLSALTHFHTSLRGGANMGANFGIAGLDWQQRVNWDRMRKYRLERARERMKAHGLGAMLLHVRRERALPDRHADAGLEPPEARPALRDALRRRSAGAVRAGRPRLPDRAPFAVDSEGERPLVVRLDQGRGRARLDASRSASSPRRPRADEEERRRRA